MEGRPSPARLRRRESRGLTSLGVLALCALRCGDAAVTQLLVVVSTEPQEGLPVEAVEVEVQSEDGLSVYDRRRFPIVGAPGGRDTLPLSFGVAPRVADASGRVRVVARALLREGSASRPLAASALTSFVAGEKRLLPLVLDYRCTLAPACNAGFSCNAQECVSEERAASTLALLRPGESPALTPPGGACARPADGCIDRCSQGSRVAVTRFANRAMQTTLTTTPETPPCCNGQVIAQRDVFFVSPTPRRDLLPLYVCRSASDTFFYSLLASCEAVHVNAGVLGYIVSPATPGRCGTVPLYRLYNGATVDHYYTTSEAERDRLVATGRYAYEQVAGYVWPEAVR